MSWMRGGACILFLVALAGSGFAPALPRQSGEAATLRVRGRPVILPCLGREAGAARTSGIHGALAGMLAENDPSARTSGADTVAMSSRLRMGRVRAEEVEMR